MLTSTLHPFSETPLGIWNNRTNSFFFKYHLSVDLIWEIGWCYCKQDESPSKVLLLANTAIMAMLLSIGSIYSGFISVGDSCSCVIDFSLSKDTFCWFPVWSFSCFTVLYWLLTRYMYIFFYSWGIKGFGIVYKYHLEWNSASSLSISCDNYPTFQFVKSIDTFSNKCLGSCNEVPIMTSLWVTLVCW